MEMKKWIASGVSVAMLVALGVFARVPPRLCELSSLIHIYRAFDFASEGDFDAAARSVRTAISFAPRHGHENRQESDWSCIRRELETTRSQSGHTP